MNSDDFASLLDCNYRVICVINLWFVSRGSDLLCAFNIFALLGWFCFNCDLIIKYLIS